MKNTETFSVGPQDTHNNAPENSESKTNQFQSRVCFSGPDGLESEIRKSGNLGSSCGRFPVPDGQKWSRRAVVTVITAHVLITQKLYSSSWEANQRPLRDGFFLMFPICHGLCV